MLSHHAQQRLQQRAIPALVIEILLDHGVVEHSKRGLEMLYLTKKGKHAAMMQMKAAGMRHSDHYLNAFLIESSDGNIVTVGHRTKKINRN